MALTKAKISNIDTSIEFFQDPIILLNEKSTLANIDVGFVFNRNGGTDPNVSIYWNETTKSFTLAYTANNGILNSNISVNSYANITVGNISSSGNVSAQYFLGNGALLTGIVAGSSYSNVQVATYLPTYTGVVTASNVAVNGNVTAAYFLGNGSQLTGIAPYNQSLNTTDSVRFGTLRVGFEGLETIVYNDGITIQGSFALTAAEIATYSGNVGALNFVGYNQAQVGSSFAYATDAFGADQNGGNVSLPADTNSNAIVAGYTIVGNSGAVTLMVTSATFVAGTPNFVQVDTAPTAVSFTYPVTVYSADYSPALSSNITVGNATVSGNVSAQYVLGSGQFLTGLPAGYSNVNVKAYTESMGFQNFGNANVAAYTQTQSYTNYSNVNLSAYLGGAVTIGGNLTVNGNLFVNGNLTTINANNLNISDSMIYLADDNPADILDIGIVSAFTNAVRYQHTGFVRDATDGVWKLFANVVPEPTTTVDFTNANYSNILVGNIQATYFTGNGAFLTGLPAGYSNVNAATFLASGTLTSPIITTGTAATGNLTVNSGEAAAYAVVSNINAYQTSMSVNTAAGSLAVSWGTNASPSTFMSMTASGGTNQINSAARNFKVNFTALNDALLLYAANGAAVFNSTIASTSTTTGALVVAGGAGVGGALNVGGNLTVSGNLISPNIYSASSGNVNLNLYSSGTGVIRHNVANSITWLMSSPSSTVARLMAGGQSTLEARLSVPNWLNVQTGSSADFTNEGVVQLRVSHTASAVNRIDITGAATGGSPKILAIGTDGNINLTLSATGNGNITTANTVVISNSSASTSTTTGALTVTGGVGIGGNVYTGGRAGFTYANNVSAVYQVYNSATNSLDTVFG